MSEKMNRKATNSFFIHIQKSACVKMSKQRQMIELDFFSVRNDKKNAAMTLR